MAVRWSVARVPHPQAPGLRRVTSQESDSIGYHLEVVMADILIRNIPEAELAEIDARAAILKLSRNEYIRRQLAQAVRTTSAPVDPPTLGSLQQFAAAFSDLGDADAMRAAWE